MWHVPIELHEASLRLMRRLMHCLLLLPPRPHWYLKSVYMIALLMYFGYVMHWRIGLNYHVVYDIKNDNFSRFIDLLNYVALIICHFGVAVELMWRNHSDEIEQQLERIRYMLRVQFGYKVNLLRIRRYCQGIYVSLFLRITILFAMIVYNNMVTDVTRVLYYAYYSEVVLLSRLSEFSLYSALIMVFYQDLCEVSFNIIMELERTSSEVWSVHRKSLERLLTLQQVHSILWNTIRSIECHFELSLIKIMVKLFVDIFVLPYWIVINLENHVNPAAVHYCIAEEICKFLEVLVPCLIWNSCAQLQRRFRSTFHHLSSNRSNVRLNNCLLQISANLGQENCQFSAGGFMTINNEALGKFIFGVTTYIVICIQFRMFLLEKGPTDA